MICAEALLSCMPASSRCRAAVAPFVHSSGPHPGAQTLPIASPVFAQPSLAPPRVRELTTSQGRVVIRKVSLPQVPYSCLILFKWAQACFQLLFHARVHKRMPPSLCPSSENQLLFWSGPWRWSCGWNTEGAGQGVSGLGWGWRDKNWWICSLSTWQTLTEHL